MNLVRGINGRILSLEERRNSTPAATENDPDREDKNETKTATRTSSLMTVRS
nr:hypothetical protein [uncultured bacterium]